MVFNGPYSGRWHLIHFGLGWLDGTNRAVGAVGDYLKVLT